MPNPLYASLKGIATRPEPYSHYTTKELWTGAHVAKKMLEYHLNPESDLASRKPEFIGRSVQWMKEYFKIRPGTRIADFGCGPGLYAERLAKLGAKVTGIDFSANSLRYARQHARSENLDIDYQEADYLNYEGTPGSFDLICLIYCDLCPLSPVQRAKLLGTLRRLVAPGGAILLDVWTRRYFDSRKEESSYERRQMDGFWAEGDYFGFHNAFKYEKEQVVLDEYSIAEPERTYTIYNWLQCYTAETLEAELAAAGLKLRDTFGDVAGGAYTEDSPTLAAVAQLA